MSFAVGPVTCSLSYENTKRTRVRYERVQGRGSGSSWNAHQASQGLATSAQRLATFAAGRKHKAHLGAVWEGSRERVMVLREMLSRPQRGY